MTGVVVFGEDTGRDGIAVVRAVVERTLRLIGAELAVMPPLDEAERAAGTLAAWRARTAAGHSARVRLLNVISTYLDKGRVVAVMVDADAPWSTRAERSDNVRDLDELVLVHHRGRPVIGMVPYAAIEAWLFRGVHLVPKLAEQPAVAAKVTAWRADPGALDEAVPPKAELPFADRHNLALAEVFPTRAVRDLGLSYAAFAEALASLVPTSRP
ncbi:MAG: hypothetical protein ABMB14_27750 [Myxococcota bacterium]